MTGETQFSTTKASLKRIKLNWFDSIHLIHFICFRGLNFKVKPLSYTHIHNAWQIGKPRAIEMWSGVAAVARDEEWIFTDRLLVCAHHLGLPLCVCASWHSLARVHRNRLAHSRDLLISVDLSISYSMWK